MKPYTTELDSIQDAIGHAVKSKRHMHTIMINQHYYNSEVSRAASDACDQLAVLLVELRRVEVTLTPPVESGPMVGWAFLSPEEKDEADRIAGGKL
tara:strand:+ start:163 stop:450 length:288 start_codon:yes stop_codon:yes gene_type:complete